MVVRDPFHHGSEIPELYPHSFSSKAVLASQLALRLRRVKRQAGWGIRLLKRSCARAMTTNQSVSKSSWKWFFGLAGIAVLVAGGASISRAGDVFAKVRSKGVVRCGVSEGLLGFSMKEPTGRWSGLDADFCRAVAAAALGTPEKVAFVPLITSARFLALRSGQIDLLARHTTWTLGREVGLGVHFVGVLYYDGQAFMVGRKSGIGKLEQLNGAAICVEKETTSAENLEDYFRNRGWKYQPVWIKSPGEATSALPSGRCRAFTSDRGQLASVRATVPGGSGAFLILPGEISKEPLGPAVLQGDDEWFTLVRWVFFALVAAEEHGVTRDSVQGWKQTKADAGLADFFAASERYSKALGVKPDWLTQTIESVGNYGEIFERNLGGQSTLKLERGLNRLWTRGGLMYAPPFR